MTEKRLDTILPVDLSIACWTEESTIGTEVNFWFSRKRITGFAATFEKGVISVDYANPVDEEAKRYKALIRAIAQTKTIHATCSGNDSLVLSFKEHFSPTQFAAVVSKLVDAFEAFFGATNSKVRFGEELPKDFVERLQRRKEELDDLNRIIAEEEEVEHFDFAEIGDEDE